jgi:membrane-associated phospholipid phosphatase
LVPGSNPSRPRFHSFVYSDDFDNFQSADRGLAGAKSPACSEGFLILKRVASVIRLWALSLLICAVVVAFSFVRLDVPAALLFWNVGRHLSHLTEGFGADVVLSAESAVLLIMVVARLVRGHISPFGAALALACLASMCAYVVNDHVLKVFFGVPNPTDVINGARHGFNILMGSGASSFPSGHMALAGAFSGVFMRLHRVSIWPLAALLLLAAVLLLLGDWHFLSDIIAGTFLGTSAGILAAEAWAVHSAR